MKYQSGPASAPTVVANGTDGSETDPRIVLFDSYARPCIVMNGTGNGNDIRVKVNAEAGNDFDNDSDDDGPGYFAIADGETCDVSIGGQLSVTGVSFITTAGGDDLDNVSVVGW